MAFPMRHATCKLATLAQQKLTMNFSRLHFQDSKRYLRLNMNTYPSRSFASKKVAKLFELTNYSDEEQEKILTFVNNASLKQLKDSQMSGLGAFNIVKTREEGQNYNSLTNILEVFGVTADNFEKLCQTVLRGKALRTQKMCTPNLTDKLKKSAKDLVALRVDLFGLIWIHMTRDLQLLEWEKFQFSEIPKPMSAIELFQHVQQFVQVLPKADLYIMEEIPRPVRAIFANVPIVVSRVALQATLVSALNPSYLKTHEHQAFIIKSHVMMKYFGLVGDKKTSCLRFVNSLLHKKNLIPALPSEDDHWLPELNKNICDKLIITNKLVQDFQKQKQIVQGEFGILLLAGLCFHDLILG